LEKRNNQTENGISFVPLEWTIPNDIVKSCSSIRSTPRVAQFFQFQSSQEGEKKKEKVSLLCMGTKHRKRSSAYARNSFDQTRGDRANLCVGVMLLPKGVNSKHVPSCTTKKGKINFSQSGVKSKGEEGAKGAKTEK
jgi:hypothetical protein